MGVGSTWVNYVLHHTFRLYSSNFSRFSLMLQREVIRNTCAYKLGKKWRYFPTSESSCVGQLHRRDSYRQPGLWEFRASGNLPTVVGHHADNTADNPSLGISYDDEDLSRPCKQIRTDAA